MLVPSADMICSCLIALKANHVTMQVVIVQNMCNFMEMKINISYQLLLS